MDQNKEINFNSGYYLVAFIDLLGQQENFKKFNKLPDKNSPAEMEEFKNTILDIYRPVHDLRRIFSDCFEAFLKPSIYEQFIPSEQIEELRKLRSNEIKYQPFSDCIVIYLSLQDNLNKVPLRGIYSVITSAAVTFISCLSRSYFLRGAIDIGLGTEIDGKEIYGPVLSSAYNLESKVAKYPRIVIGQGLEAYLRAFATESSDDIFINMNKELTDRVMGLLALDDDGIPIIDYLGDFFRDNFKDQKIWELIPTCYNEIVKASEKCKALKDTQLAFRHTLLRNYFDVRKSNWNIPLNEHEN